MQRKMFMRFPEFMRKISLFIFFPLSLIQSVAELKILIRFDSMAFLLRTKEEVGENRSPAELHLSWIAFVITSDLAGIQFTRVKLNV